MNDLFGISSMGSTYEQRKVERFEDSKRHIVVDTAAVTDSDKPYETAIKHPKYNGGNWIVVQLYNTKEEAIIGHKKWVIKMTSDKLPKKIKDVSTSIIIDLINFMAID
jgi:hypothetical protein